MSQIFLKTVAVLLIIGTVVPFIMDQVLRPALLGQHFTNAVDHGCRPAEICVRGFRLKRQKMEMVLDVAASTTPVWLRAAQRGQIVKIRVLPGQMQELFMKKKRFPFAGAKNQTSP